MAEAELLLMDKEEGVTSFSSLSQVKRSHKGMKVGHAGTLDKFASGLMIVLVGKATRLNPVFSSMGKSYIAEITFGKETDTLDPEGEVIATASSPSLSRLKEVLPSFIGRQEQIPPVYSAIHVGGRRAYQEARRGSDVEMAPRIVEISSLELLSYDGEKAVISTSVSKGTYIRSLARDIGRRAGSAAFVSRLRRTSIGPFTLSDIGLDTFTLLDRTELFSSVTLRTESRRALENGRIEERAVISDTDPERPFAYIIMDGIRFGFAERRDGHLHLLGRF